MKQIHGVWFPESDTHFIDHVHKNGDYQRDTFQAAMNYVKEPKIFYDIGAHVGLWSLMAHRAGFKEINSYEPNPNTFKCLKRNTKELTNIHIHDYAIGKDNLSMTLCYEKHDNSGAVRLVHEGEPNVWVHGFFTASMTIAKELSNHEVLVKIDTEGMEAECVIGFESIIKLYRPVICVEQRTNNDALDILQKMGMQIVQQVRKDYILTWKNQ